MKQLKSELDRISELPDSLRCHILSLLPTKDAVATSFLSTKWRNIWTTIPDISFSDSEMPDNTNFGTFVNRVLLFHNAPSINKFYLEFFSEDDSSYDYHAWVTWAILKKAREVDLNLHTPNDISLRLPLSLFTCQTLEVLKLEGTILVQVKTMLCLPKLKALELLDIQYQNDESAQNLISSCASLESLHVRRTKNDGVHTFTISSSTLKVLVAALCISHTLEILKYVIKAPALQHFNIMDGSAIGFLIENSTSLMNVGITDTYSGWVSTRSDYVAFNNKVPHFLQGICSTKTLYLEQEIFQSSIPSSLFPKFNRLTVLGAKADCCHWSLLQAFINNSEKLEQLIFKKVPCLMHGKERNTVCWRNLESVPNCLLTSLRIVAFSGFDGWEDELAMVKYMLQNGLVMQKMRIKMRRSLDDKMKVELLQKLLKFRRGSVRCEVTIF